MDFGIKNHNVLEVVKKLDHTYLTEHPVFCKSPHSSENMAVFIADEVQKLLGESDRFWVSKVHVWESDDSCATYVVER